MDNISYQAELVIGDREAWIAPETAAFARYSALKGPK